MRSTKTDIINHLAAARSYCSYLEICTTVTGNHYGEIDRSQFSTCHRLMSCCPDGYSDGMAIDFRVTGLDISECVMKIKAMHGCYDVILVDPWHEYETSYRALEAALTLVSENGTIIVHDCFPPTPWHASPVYAGGEWCGLTYKAYLDFVLARKDIAYLTIDTDFGCGIIRKTGDRGTEIFAPKVGQRRKGNLSALIIRRRQRDPLAQRSLLVREWTRLGDDFDETFRFLHAHKAALMNLVSSRQFRRAARENY